MLRSTRWQYAEHDLAAAHVLERRVAEHAARQPGFIVYSDLISGVDFHLPQMQGGRAFQIDPHDWRGIDRRIVGDFRGYLSMLSHERAGFLLGALVVSKDEARPSDVFFDWMRDNGVLPDLSDETVIPFWTRHFNEGKRWYRQHPNEPFVVAR